MKIQHKRFTTKRPFGVELEVNATITQDKIREIIKHKSTKPVLVTAAWAYSSHNDYWHVKFDRSCGVLGKHKDHGWEIASYIASGFKDILHIAQIADALEAGGATVNDNCGLHIHVGIKDFTPKEAGILLARWLRIESLFCKMLPLHRTSNSYCRLLTRLKRGVYSPLETYDPNVFWLMLRPTDMSVHENRQKKVALNLVNYTRCLSETNNDGRMTVELRMPEGTLDGQDVKNWIRFFLLFVEKCKSSPMPEHVVAVKTIQEFLQFFDLSGEEDFYLLSKGLYETKLWVLKRFMLFGGVKEANEARKLLKMMV